MAFLVEKLFQNNAFLFFVSSKCILNIHIVFKIRKLYVLLKQQMSFLDT